MSVVDNVLGVLAPQTCISCGIEGSVLCASCLELAGEPVEPRCAGCHALSRNYRTCSSCRSWLDIYAVIVATKYEGLYEQLLRSFKFELMRQASLPIAKMMASMKTDSNLPEEFILCPLPTAPKRIRARGFDHTKLLAIQISKDINIQKPEYLLGRNTNTRQLGSNRSQRMQQMEKEFYYKGSGDLAGKTVLIIDDVTTTGASLSAASRTLKKAGAKRVYGLVFAQKV